MSAGKLIKIAGYWFLLQTASYKQLGLKNNILFLQELLQQEEPK